MLNDCREYGIRILGQPVNFSDWAGMSRQVAVLGEGDQAGAPAAILSICLAGSEVSAFAGLDISGKCFPAALFQGRSDCRAVCDCYSCRGQGRSGAATAWALPSCRSAFARPCRPERYSIAMPAPTALFPFGVEHYLHSSKLTRGASATVPGALTLNTASTKWSSTGAMSANNASQVA